jgi:hypothetical protein
MGASVLINAGWYNALFGTSPHSTRMTTLVRRSLFMMRCAAPGPSVKGVAISLSLLPRFLAYMFAIALLLACWNGAFPLDDAYIVLHNARVLGGGAEPLPDLSADRVNESNPLGASFSTSLLLSTGHLLLAATVAQIPTRSVVLIHDVGIDHG